MPPPYLTDDEITELCKPLKMPAAQRRHLERLGLIVKAKPNGRPIVARRRRPNIICRRLAVDPRGRSRA